MMDTYAEEVQKYLATEATGYDDDGDVDERRGRCQ